MASSSAGTPGARRARASSAVSHSSSRLVPGRPDSLNGSSYPTGDESAGRGPMDILRPSIRSATPSGQREYTRSFISSSYRGPTAPTDSAQYSRSIREDTAELANYALSDTASIRSSSPPLRHHSFQGQLESYFTGLDGSAESTGREEAILEVSEPVSPIQGPPLSNFQDSSNVGYILKNSAQSPSPPRSTESGHNKDIRGDGNEVDRDQSHLDLTANGIGLCASERTPLLAKDHPPSESQHYIGDQDIEGQKPDHHFSWPRPGRVLSKTKAQGLAFARRACTPKQWNRLAIWQSIVVDPISYLPAAILGLLLNILDALSYGMILFPLGQPIFEKLGAAGISMFYVSTIISQLVYSSGGSIFKGGIGSEMIEVVPFFHKMAFTIMEKVGEENPKAVIATTITSYAISSVLTGLVFFLMGTCGFGYIVGFIPRHILIGCIGGVGWFLIATGFEVTARLDGNLNYDLATLRKIFEADTVPLWLIPLVLAIVLYFTQQRVSTKYYLPMYILTIPAVFYFFVTSLDELEPSNLRKAGWIFEGPEAGEPWWYFYTLYDFKLVHWDAVASTIPAMFALTFFGVLHVPINVPALAFNVGEDNVNLDRELIAHGISNALSGFAGSIQNYLVYSNSVLFMKAGADGRLAGITLVLLTVVVLMIGPVIIGYIPVMMVGTLVFVLGFELFIEAVWEPRKKLRVLEYLTVIAIVLIMGIYDFVAGIFIGIGLAFVALVVQTSRVPAVRADYSGEIAGSTVRRSPTQSRYLREVGQQIHITKLAGYLFFGTIVSVEERIRSLIGDEAFHKRPIRFLIFDLSHVTGIDYSAAEAFNRLNRVFSRKGVTLSMSGVRHNGSLGQSLLAVGLGQEGNEVSLFEDLNSALESCENHLLKTLYSSKETRNTRNAPTQYLDMPVQDRLVSANTNLDHHFSSPRSNQLHRSAATALDAHPQEPRYTNLKEPLRLILQTFQGLTSKNEDFWFRAVPFFQRRTYIGGTILFRRGQEAEGFYLLEQGILRADYVLPQGRYFESIVAGTTCGELPFFSESERTATVQAERDCVAWLLTREKWQELEREHPDVAQELLRMSLRLTSESMEAITSSILITAG